MAPPRTVDEKLTPNQCFRVGIIVVLSTLVGEVCGADPPVDYGRDVRPVLSEKCFQCHGPDAEHREAELRLDTQQGAMADLGGRRAIVAGDPTSSEMVRRITSSDADERMPPVDSGKSLTAEEVEQLTRWIEQGANWSQHWAYVTPSRHPTPTVDDVTWPINWIDEFILAKIEAEELEPAPQADPVTLVRRLHFDLIGLPPDFDVVVQYITDGEDRRAYEQLVDSLLASPHFGERMAIYWLDLVRYADTVGYHGDQDQSISPYRDYVIDAFNRNLPFDRFTREQLAGDLLPDASIDQQVATGYNRLLQTSHEGGVQPKEYLAIYAADRVRNVSSVWMGATLGCAQCHDHKYDPYTARDFYSMAAFFADVDEESHFSSGTNGLPTKRLPELAVLSRIERERRQALSATIDQLKQQHDEAGDHERAEIQSQIERVQAERRSINVNKRMTMITKALDEPRTTRIFPRGNWLDESGPVVQPAIPQFLGMVAAGQGRANRLDLANWLTNPDTGSGLLTARVFVNRVWYLFFGHGLARSLDDFGGQGFAPDYPQLLDRLAIDFVDGDWNIKRLVKQIVMSRTYRQSSQMADASFDVDPDNRLVARQTRHRLPAEMVRDNALAISGLLVDRIGGSSARPYQPAGYYRHLNFPKRTYQHDTDRQQWRRGIYVHWQRQYLHPTLKALDAPSREECTAQRPRSNTPLAALALLNDPTFVEAARAFAARIMMYDASDEARLTFAFRTALSREPDKFERLQIMGLLATYQSQYEARPDLARQLVDIGSSEPDPSLDVVDLAAWTGVARGMLNLHELMTRY